MRGETCGALTGAIMAIGSLVGRERMEDTEKLQSSMEPASRVYAQFKKKIGHTLCAEIHRIRYGRAFRLFLPEDLEAFHHAGGHTRKGCPDICGVAARIAAEVILELVPGKS